MKRLSCQEYRPLIPLTALAAIMTLSVQADGPPLAIHDLGTLGGNFSEATAINDRGQVTGPYTTSDGRTHGYLKDGDTFLNIDVPGAVFTMPHGINAVGEVVGEYRTPDGVTHGFVLTHAGFEPIDVPGLSFLYGINPRGDLVGSYTEGGRLHGFAIWK